MLFCGIKFDKKFACLCFKFIKEILGWMSLNLLNFISRFLSKKCFLSAREILGFARSLAGFCHLALLCRSCKRYENFSLTMHLLQISSSPSCHAQTAPLVQSSKISTGCSTAKTFNFTAQTSLLHHFRHIALLAKFILKALKNVVCSPPQ